MGRKTKQKELMIPRKLHLDKLQFIQR